MNLSYTEENYLKAIYHIKMKSGGNAGTNAISESLLTAPASVTDMLKKLAEKNLVAYEKYKGVKLTEIGSKIATQLVRNHRIWEVFLVDKLGYSWDEVHDIAEQLEHVQSETLINKLADFLENPRFDPHGDPIPDANGKIYQRKQILISNLQIGAAGEVVGVNEHSPEFLKYLNRIQLNIGTKVKVIEKFSFDGSQIILVDDVKELTITYEVAKNIFVTVVNNES
ncbi:MAG: metal-dependent transcriptional regulator [Saprospiraceae bacterium]|jgi:DtxR family Mn-dependent transcriptional regulator|nr:metal-dependent transcriptional regulator [Saprospiraceae bacterium]